MKYMKTINILTGLFLLFPLLSTAQSAGATDNKWTVQEAIHFAFDHSPDSTIAQKRIEIAEALVSQSRSGQYPQVHLIGEYSQTNNPMYSFGNILNQGEFDNSIDFNNPGRTDNLQIKAEIRYRLYNGGGVNAGIRASEAQSNGSRLMLKSIHNKMAFEVTRLFHMIIQAKEMMTAREKALKAIGVSLTVAKARFDAGDLLKQDLLNIELQESMAKDNLIQARHDLALTQRGFLNLLGLTDPSVTIDPSSDCKPQMPEPHNPVTRPEILQIEAMIQAAEAKLEQVKSGKRPVIDTFANYQFNTGSVLDGSGDSWMAGIRLDYTLFDGGRLSSGLQVALANVLKAKEEKKKIILAINLEMEQARLGFQQADEKLQVTGKMVDLATESARLSRIRFKEGVILASDLIDVETRLTDARVQQSAASAMRKIAIADLRRAMGLPQFEE